MSKSALMTELEWRGLVHTITPEADLSEQQVVYIGIDPTATSLHVGSLLPIMCMNKFIDHGHKVILLIGNGTAMIGDPSGKKNERSMLENVVVNDNMEKLELQLKSLVPYATVVRNAAWLAEFSILGFLRQVGKHFSLNYMRAKESVRSREEAGISFTEFSYMLLQAYDFLHLWEEHGCTMQIGGSDQWGNITCGIELIKRTHNKNAHGLTFPLLTGSNGEKFGKSAHGTVWLDKNRTSPYHFHQFWLNVEDKDVIQYLKYFTTLSQDAIQNIEDNLSEYSDKRIAQNTLADAVTRFVHGDLEVLRINQVRELLFGEGGDMSSLTEKEITDLLGELIVPCGVLPDSGLRLTELLHSSGLYASKGAARRVIESGGIYVNGERSKDVTIMQSNLLHDRYLVVRKGKKDYSLLLFEPIGENAIA
jgi:tyrosyl-tRNA synthetase